MIILLSRKSVFLHKATWLSSEIRFSLEEAGDEAISRFIRRLILLNDDPCSCVKPKHARVGQQLQLRPFGL